VTRCGAYHFVETKHEQPHIAKIPDFEPRNGSPTIHVNVRTTPRSIVASAEKEEDDDDDDDDYSSSSDTQTAAPELAIPPTTPILEEENDGLQQQGATAYGLPSVTTYEYDVVKCADFIQDTGSWVRNMPQEIKDANPDFVPS
jgi:hypothetical protein